MPVLSTKSKKIFLEPNTDHLKRSNDFFSKFEEFFEVDASTNRGSGDASKSPNRTTTGMNREREEYFENLRLSGNFLSAQISSDRKLSVEVSRSNSQQAEKNKLKLDMQREIDMYKYFDNVFDLSDETNEVAFAQLTLENMQKRSKLHKKRPSLMKQSSPSFLVQPKDSEVKPLQPKDGSSSKKSSPQRLMDILGNNQNLSLQNIAEKQAELSLRSSAKVEV